VLARFAALTALLLTACATDFAEEELPREAPTTMSTPIPLLRATFEPASPDCNGWVAEGARSIRSVPARSGSYACKLCADGTRTDLVISYRVGALEPGRYVLSAYTRKRPQNAAPPAAFASVEAATAAGPVVAAARETALREEWDRLEAIIDVPDGATSAHVRIGAAAAAQDECVLVDDVAIEKQ
jgi:hypothetical protein